MAVTVHSHVMHDGLSPVPASCLRLCLRMHSQAGNYDPRYRCEHYDGKARVAEWMQAQPSDAATHGMSWSVITSGPYMDMLFNVRI